MKVNSLICYIVFIIIAAFSTSAQASHPNLTGSSLLDRQAPIDATANPIPEASIECSAEVEKWWGQVRQTGLQVIQLRKQLDLAEEELQKANKANPNMTTQEYWSIRDRTVTPAEKALNQRSEQFRSLLKEGITKGYKAPIANSRMIVLDTEKPRYTEEARKRRIEGQVTLRVILQADGRVTNIQVVQGLGYGLDEQAVIAVGKIVFLPRVVDGRFESRATPLAAEFNLR